MGRYRTYTVRIFPHKLQSPPLTLILPKTKAGNISMHSALVEPLKTKLNKRQIFRFAWPMTLGLISGECGPYCHLDGVDKNATRFFDFLEVEMFN